MCLGDIEVRRYLPLAKRLVTERRQWAWQSRLLPETRLDAITNSLFAAARIGPSLLLQQVNTNTLTCRNDVSTCLSKRRGPARQVALWCGGVAGIIGTFE